VSVPTITAYTSHYRDGFFTSAMWLYLLAMAHLSPWYPLEWWLPVWESKLLGLTDL